MDAWLLVVLIYFDGAPAARWTAIASSESGCIAARNYAAAQIANGPMRAKLKAADARKVELSCEAVKLI